MMSGCATPPPITVVPEKPKIKRITVQSLIGANKADFTPEIIAALQRVSVAVVGKAEATDAVLISEVMNYKTGRKLLIYLGNTPVLSKDQAQMLSNPLYSSGSGQLIPQLPSTGGPVPRMVTENAVVHMRMRLVDSTGKPLWINEYSYEALDIAQARHAVIVALIQAMKSALLL